MKKTLDCVDLQHSGHEKVRARLEQMTLDEQVAYWERRASEIQRKKAKASRGRKAS